MFLTEKELASCLKVSTVYLYQCRKKGMPYIQFGSRCIRYSLDDVLLWFNNESKTAEKGEN